MMNARIDHALIRTPVAWPLRIMIAIIVFIAGFGLLSAWALSLSASQLDHGLRGQLTIELPPDDNGKIDNTLTAALVKDISTLHGVLSAQALTLEQTAELLRPWLGAETLDAKNIALLPLPQLIDVHVSDAEVAATLTPLLHKKYPTATLADHQQWIQKLAGQARLAAYGLLALVLVLLLALLSTVAFACRAGLNVQLPTVALLHVIGATDAHICNQMQRYAWRLVWPGCVLGVIACGLASAGLIHLVALLSPNKYSIAQDSFWTGAVILGLGLPVLTLFFARVSAQFATQRVLRAMP
jgi:cell division transport system permease protein